MTEINLSIFMLNYIEKLNLRGVKWKLENLKNQIAKNLKI